MSEIKITVEYTCTLENDDEGKPLEDLDVDWYISEWKERIVTEVEEA